MLEHKPKTLPGGTIAPNHYINEYIIWYINMIKLTFSLLLNIRER